MFMQSQEYCGADSGIHALLLRHFDRQAVQPAVALTTTPFEEDPAMDSGRRFRVIPDLRVRPTYFGPHITQTTWADRLRSLPAVPRLGYSLASLAAMIRR